ncbi:hypothetical protein LTR78_001625 [Recurvomyces mirabilis]|uniref:Uncharacterized protein n=1 Tax=Recurvomyces mirabilis TaxID=574656 RepID=A0AAE0WUZ8_9PEZI|nr:hypothetical protein LTR78_001625 [Recurvomyces mirabilis]KAK5151805.1 hypothetical protein LTS14_008937 [Recurvomyces mirabilis]
MTGDLMQNWERHKQRYAQSGTTQFDDFWDWIERMRNHEVASRKNERVYLVISKLRRVADNERHKVGPSGVSSVFNSMPPFAMRSSASIRSGQSMRSESKRKEPSRHDRSHWDSCDSRDDLSSGSDDDNEGAAKLKKQVKNVLTVGAKMIASALSSNNAETSDTEPQTSNSSSEQQSRRRRDSGRPRFVSGYPSPPGVMPAKAYTDSLQNAPEIRHRKSGYDSKATNAVHHGVRTSHQSLSPQIDSPAEADVPTGSLPTKSSHAFSPPQSHFQGSKTSEQHWAVEVCEKMYGDGVKAFSRFTCIHRVGLADREITEKIYVGRTHMSHRVLKEIGEGIMKTQPKYTLPSDNCQHFMAVYLPRILCHRHAHLTTLPNASVGWAYKFTTLPTYLVGVKGGLVTQVEHRYFHIASGIRQFLDHWKAKQAVAERSFESRETSSYHFTLQGNDPGQFTASCRTIRQNPYLIIHREFSKSETRPLGDSQERANTFWMWEINRKIKMTPQLRELEMEQDIEIAKGIWKGLRKQKMGYEQEVAMRVKVMKEMEEEQA